MKNHSYFLFVVLSFFSTFFKIYAASFPEEEAISIVAQFAERWNLHKPKEMADLWLENGDLIAADGRWAKGRDEIEHLFLQEQTEEMKNSNLYLTVKNIRIFAQDVAWIDVDAIILNISDGPNISRTFEHHAIFLVVKQDEHWFIVSVRPYQFFHLQRN